MPRPSDIWYVYGVVPRAFDLAHAPGGLDDVPIELCEGGELAAIVSRLDGENYAPATLEQATEDVEWLAPRAVAHDRVLTWVSDHGPVVPLPIFSLFSGAPAVKGMLRERRAQLAAALVRAALGREYALRVYRVDSELAKSAAELSPKLALLRDAAAAARPGQRYLLERKLETERKNELHLIGARLARDECAARRQGVTPQGMGAIRRSPPFRTARPHRSDRPSRTARCRAPSGSGTARRSRAAGRRWPWDTAGWRSSTSRPPVTSRCPTRPAWAAACTST